MMAREPHYSLPLGTRGFVEDLEGWRNQVVMDAVRRSDSDGQWIEVAYPRR